MRCGPLRCEPVRCTPVRCTPVRETPKRHAHAMHGHKIHAHKRHAREIHAHDIYLREVCGRVRQDMPCEFADSRIRIRNCSPDTEYGLGYRYFWPKEAVKSIFASTKYGL